MVSDPTNVSRAAWKESVVYQIYPRSFNDSDGDGVGDIPGIVEKADYLDDLGVDIVWLCPVYDSPQVDNGYDIRDYRAIDDRYGDMADWEDLLAALHDRDIGLVMDLVVNHTSAEHEWFRKSREREGRYEDYYYWRDGDPEEPPNNWESFFGGPAWSYDEGREQWYLHLFDETQPDLNWRNPDVRADLKAMIRWWLEKGIDGFRMDVINLLSKAEGLPDGDTTGVSLPVGSEHFVGGPRIHEYLRGLYDDVFSEYDVVTVGEMVALTVADANDYLGPDGDGLNMAFHFDHVSVDYGEAGRWSVGDWDLTDLKSIFEEWQTGLDETAWDAIHWENHDQPRSVSRFGDVEQYHEKSAKLLATFLTTHRGTPYVYQGEEIGMQNADFRSLEECRDVAVTNRVETALETGAIDSYEDVRAVVNYRSRDHARTPMQWSDDENAGFTDGDPWIKVNETYSDWNVERQRTSERSVWSYYRDLIDLRHGEDVLVYGDFELLVPDDEAIYAFVRTLGTERALVVLNWTDESNVVDLRDHLDAVGSGDAASSTTASASLLIANYDDAGPGLGELDLRPYEARVYRIEGS